jgi:hypothetical protein
MRFINKSTYFFALICALLLFPLPCIGDPAAGQSSGPAKHSPANESAQVKIIGYTFRLLAKGIVAASDINSLKAKNMEKLNKMSRESFHARYLDIYEHLYEVPFFTKNYGLNKDTTKEEVMEKIKGLDKDKLYAAVDALPDTLIANEFNRFMFKNKQAVPNSADKKGFLDSLNQMLDYLKKKYL